jgi:cbb3-type cytochrome oxidase maturation protein
MTSLAWLIPAALALGGLGLAAFLWSLKSGQYDDLEGAAWRALEDRPPAAPENVHHKIADRAHQSPAGKPGNAEPSGVRGRNDGDI